MVFANSLLGIQYEGDSIEMSQQVCLLYLLERHLTRFFHICVADRWCVEQSTCHHESILLWFAT